MTRLICVNKTTIFGQRLYGSDLQSRILKRLKNAREKNGKELLLIIRRRVPWIACNQIREIFLRFCDRFTLSFLEDSILENLFAKYSLVDCIP